MGFNQIFIRATIEHGYSSVKSEANGHVSCFGCFVVVYVMVADFWDETDAVTPV